jgi:hypothetical protein
MTFTYLADPEDDGSGVLMGDDVDVPGLVQQVAAAAAPGAAWRERVCYAHPCDCGFETAVNNQCIWGPGGASSWYDSELMRPFAGDQAELDLVEFGERVADHVELLGTLRMPCRIPGEISPTCGCDHCEWGRNADLADVGHQADNTSPKKTTQE